MKGLRLDIEIAKSGKDYLKATELSRDTVNTNRDLTIGNISTEDSRVESRTNINCEQGQDEMQDSPLGNMPENSLRQLDQEPEVNIAQAVTDGNILKDDVELRESVNVGFVLDPNELNVQITKQKNLDTYTSFNIEGQHTGSITGAATNIDSAETCGNSRKKQAVPCYDPIFRNKLLKTIFLLWNMTMLGWKYGQMGPTFPDLQDIAGVSLKQGSWLFTGFAIGYLSGCLLAGFTQTRFSSNLMLFFYTVVSAGAYTLTPWIPIFEVIVFLRALGGIGIGGQDTCVHAMLFETWGDKVGPYFQMMHALYAVGGIVSPLVTKPFLRKYIQEVRLDIVNSTQTASLQNATPSLVSTISTNKTDNPDDITMTDTNVHYALIITGALLLTASAPFLVMFFKDHHTTLSKRQKNAENVSPTYKQKRLPTHIERIILCIFLLNAFVATAVLDLFPSFLTTFLIEQAGMTQQVGSNLTSAFFAMYAVGNFLNIFASICIKTTKVILFSYISTMAMFTGGLLSVLFPNEELLSAFVSLSGVTTATIVPTIYTWIQENVTPITGTLASGLLISGSLGIALNPLLIGYLMDVYSPMWFMYLSLGYIVLCAVLFIAAMLLTKIHSNKMNVTEETIREKDSNADGYKDNHIDIYVNGKLEKVYEITHL